MAKILDFTDTLVQNPASGRRQLGIEASVTALQAEIDDLRGQIHKLKREKRGY